MWVIITIVIIAILYLVFSHIFTNTEKMAGSCGLVYYVIHHGTQEEKRQIADTICEMNKRINILIEYLRTRNQKFYQKLYDEYDWDDIREDSKETYTVGKGDSIHLFMRNGDTIIPINELMFVVIHELAHIITPEYNHTPQFWRNDLYLLNASISCGIYNPIDYSRSPFQYSKDILVNSNPYFDNNLKTYLNSSNIKEGEDMA